MIGPKEGIGMISALRGEGTLVSFQTRDRRVPYAPIRLWGLTLPSPMRATWGKRIGRPPIRILRFFFLRADRDLGGRQRLPIAWRLTGGGSDVRSLQNLLENLSSGQPGTVNRTFGRADFPGDFADPVAFKNELDDLSAAFRKGLQK